VCALADDGKLQLDDPVKKYLPQFVLPDAPAGTAEAITIRDLLCHRPGLVNGGRIILLDAFTGEITDDRYFKWLARTRPSGETRYSNLHFTLEEACSPQEFPARPARRAAWTHGATRLPGPAGRRTVRGTPTGGKC
jgi:hypothetical protein